MSEVKVNKISPRTNCGTVQLGDSGDTITIPAGATITNNGTQTGFGRTGAVDWDTTAKTASFTAVSGNGYFVNTTSGAITVTLPATPSAGDIVGIKDYAATFDTNNCIVARNGSNIGGIAVDLDLDVVQQSITFVYVDGTKGWLATNDSTSNAIPNKYVTATGGTITTCGDYKIHTFTGPGTFCVSCAGNPAGSNTVDYLVVAGGGGAGEANPSPDYNYASGGGGAGGFRYSASTYTSPPCAPGHPLRSPTGLPVSATGYPIAIGAGGPGGAPGGSYGTSGSPSTFSTITSTGGGRGGIGGGGVGTPGTDDGAPGGSGGGTGALPGRTPGSGNTPPVSPPQGNNGGTGTSNNFTASGGGGGAIATGNNGAAPPTPGQEQGGNGGAGAGLPTAFGANGESCGSFRYYAGGGGGGATFVGSPQPGTNSTGGVGGGGDGRSGGSNAPSGTANTGGGGGGAGAFGGPNNGGSGGSGIIVIRYKFQN